VSAIPARLDDPTLVERLREGLRDTFFSKFDPGYLETEPGRNDLDDHAFRRYNACVESVLPWVSRHLDLHGTHVVEVGCGTGSSTAAFAGVAERVDAYDIDPLGVRGAKLRTELLGLSNVSFHVDTPETMVVHVARRRGVDVLLLYAVLEHQSLEERLELLRGGWDVLNDGGLLVVLDTPNRLTFSDAHTSLLPFFHSLPDELALAYADRSPREHFREDMRRGLACSRDEALGRLVRWGRGVSYHEFELTIGDPKVFLAASGYEEEMLRLCPPQPEESLLQTFIVESGLDVPLAFTRPALNLIFRKGGRGASVPAEPPDEPLGVRYKKLVAGLADLERRHEALLDEHRGLLEEHRVVTVAYEQLGRSRAVRLANELARYPRLRSVALWAFARARALRRR
jgi:S-adenosylmethionine-dependent methyltransferase